MALIREVIIGKSKIKAEATNLPINIVGDNDALFSLEVTRSSDGRYYNFSDNTFSSTVTPQSRLKDKSPGNYTINIPAAATGDTYTIWVWGSPLFNTTIFNKNKNLAKLTVTQYGNGEAGFVATGSVITNTIIGTVTGSSIDFFKDVDAPTIVMNEKQIAVQAAIQDYGYFITTTNSDTDLNNGTWNSDALYWSTTEANVGGTAGDSDQVVVADLTGLVVGMELTYITGTTAPGSATTITAINADTKTLTLSRNQAITSTHTMTFRAYGARLIEEAIGIRLTLTNPTVKLGQTSTTVRTELTSTGVYVDVNGTTGISKGATARFRGLDKNSSTNPCTIHAIHSASLTAGTIELTNGEAKASSDRPLRVKTKIYIDGSSNKIYLSGTIGVSRFPLTDTTINIDMDKILTQGTAS